MLFHISWASLLVSLTSSRYHEWMKSPELQQLTASEPLTLDQEYDMQKSWREDDDSEEPSVDMIGKQCQEKHFHCACVFLCCLSRVHVHNFGQAAVG